jgi:hypothetical protein
MVPALAGPEKAMETRRGNQMTGDMPTPEEEQQLRAALEILEGAAARMHRLSADRTRVSPFIEMDAALLEQMAASLVTVLLETGSSPGADAGEVG